MFPMQLLMAIEQLRMENEESVDVYEEQIGGSY